MTPRRPGGQGSPNSPGKRPWDYAKNQPSPKKKNKSISSSFLACPRGDLGSPIATSRLKTSESRTDCEGDHPQPEFRLAIDFGTTYTSITFVKGTGSEEHILNVGNFPGDRCLGRDGTQVPTEAVYLRSKSDSQDDPSVFRQTSQASLSQHTRQSRKRSIPINVLPYKYIYGYEVHRFYELPDFDIDRRDYEAPLHIRHMKLMLDKSPYVEDARKESMGVISQLMKYRVIENEYDVIRDLLASFFRHCKSSLEMDHGFKDCSSSKF
jgi:hypothetical protein